MSRIKHLRAMQPYLVERLYMVDPVYGQHLAAFFVAARYLCLDNFEAMVIKSQAL